MPGFSSGLTLISLGLYKVSFLANPDEEKNRNFAWPLSRIDKDMAPGECLNFMPKQGGLFRR